MVYSGSAVTVSVLDGGVAELSLDLQGESVNKLNLLVSGELKDAISAIAADKSIKGLLVTSKKDVFVVGADITEFGPVFEAGAEGIAKHIQVNLDTFQQLEALDMPTCVAINGYALGGGLELSLACDFRVMSTKAKIGLPETKLGLIPGWGGTSRLPRVAGVDTAVEWICGGTENGADVALAARVVDGAVAPEALRDAALTTLNRAIAGELDFKARREQKLGALKHNDIEALLSFESSKAFVKAKAGRNYPAPIKAIQVMQDAAKLPLLEAIKVETAGFVEMALTPVAKALVGLFLSDQLLGKKAKALAKTATAEIKQAAVLGAGIMGGGIAYQSSLKRVPIKMKDIAQAGIDLGLAEANKLLATRVSRGRMESSAMGEVLNRITPTLHYEGFDEVDIVVEAVVENPKVKKAVLGEVEGYLGGDAVLCSNTSTISITHLAGGLKRPENFCGMHFFNPVHRMPLVEVIRGEKTSDQAVAHTVAYANALGKKPIVVNDCPGFLVNRVLFPYFAGFSMLLRDGANFEAVDKVMERWGWPMGPAYLLDVVGIDTGVHAESVMADGFPDRMSKTFKAATDVMFEAGRLGQKTGEGFYTYKPDKKGKPAKHHSDEAYTLLAPHVGEVKEFEPDDVIARLMVPMATEMMRCLEEGVVASAAEADMALIYGLGFPPFRGGIMHWVDELGLQNFIDMADKHKALGAVYEVPESVREMAATNKKFYS